MFKNRLVLARQIRKLNQEELARKSGLKPAAISHFETGARKPSFDNLKKLADALQVTGDYLLGRTDDMEGFADVDIAFRDGIENLSDEQRKVALSVIKTLSEQK